VDVAVKATPPFEELLETLKRSAAALRDADVPFALAGGLAAWARGGPETDHDLDFVVKPEDADRALDALAQAGMRPEKPPEGWLYKAFDGDVMIDLLFNPSGIEVDNEMLERAEELEVAAIRMRVVSLEDVIATKLLALKEHELDYDSLLETVRPLREQIDWDELRRRTEHSPFAKAFFTLVEELGIA
jgi:Nucleotidyl transferase of unknown function (DUF2204)